MTFPKSDSTVLGLLLYATILLSVNTGIVCKAERATFYEDAHGRGSWWRVTITGNYCYNFPRDWNNRISSVDTHSNCIVAWDHADCTGRSERIAPGTPSHENLGAINFDNKISSVNLCSGNDNAQPSPQPTESSPPTNNELWRFAADSHNKYRRRHDVPDIRGNDAKIHNSAQRHADHLARHDRFYLSENNKYGENLALVNGANKKEAIRYAVRLWYNEEIQYDYNNPGFSRETGSFTALVWKSTTNVGMGVAWNPKRSQWVVVANYSPPGNIRGQFNQNVPRPNIALLR